MVSLQVPGRSNQGPPPMSPKRRPLTMAARVPAISDDPRACLPGSAATQPQRHAATAACRLGTGRPSRDVSPPATRVAPAIVAYIAPKHPANRDRRAPVAPYEKVAKANNAKSTGKANVATTSITEPARIAEVVELAINSRYAKAPRVSTSATKAKTPAIAAISRPKTWPPDSSLSAPNLNISPTISRSTPFGPRPSNSAELGQRLAHIIMKDAQHLDMKQSRRAGLVPARTQQENPDVYIFVHVETG